jgi:tRNA 5-methylaminomethyl-2-thiouridine biosynthesis bifunctional protein
MPLIGRHPEPAPESASNHPIFISTAHGSTGLATCPFAAELIAADICGETLPLTEEQRLLLDPNRFERRVQKKAKAHPSENRKS